MSEGIKMQLLMYIEYVKCGVKPIAFMNLQSRYITEALQLINQKELKLLIKDIQGCEEWKTIFLYKHNYLVDIINNLPNNPTSIFEHWILGKACGYSDEAIGEFING